MSDANAPADKRERVMLVVSVSPVARNETGYAALDRLRRRAASLRRPPRSPMHLFGDYRDDYVIGCYAAAIRKQERRETAAVLWLRYASAAHMRGGPTTP